MKNISNIAVVGLGYVGCAMATLLSQKVPVVGFDIDNSKIELLKSKRSPIADIELSDFLASGELYLGFQHSGEFDPLQFDVVIISTPTNFDHVKEYFDTSGVEQIIAKCILRNPDICIVIKSTIPIGFTEEMRVRYNHANIYFCPEFLREGRALYDNLYPDRIIFGGDGEFSKEFVQLLKGCTQNNCDNILITDKPTEAECIKLFSNSYIAMRVAYFNEIDSYCMSKGLNSLEIINGMGLDQRIGHHYNNPSFGYGGYCLPKDSKQAAVEMRNANCQSTIMSAINASNNERISFIAHNIMAQKPGTVGLYDFGMKSGSDNSRDAAILRVAKLLIDEGIIINVLNQSGLDLPLLENVTVFTEVAGFFNSSDLVISNRWDPKNAHENELVFTRDLFHVN